MSNPFYEEYEIIDELGDGGQGDVQLCKKKNTNEHFAVKIRTGDQDSIKREIEILTMVESRYFVRIKGAIFHNEHVYIILEYCNGKTLWEKTQNKIFSENDIYEFLKFILGAQYELIQIGIIHRDLKLKNILIHDDKYKLADFGISRHVYNYDQAGQITAFTEPSYYWSPQFNTRKYTSKCDVWSLGIIIYFLLFKQYPWKLDQNNKEQYYKDCEKLTFPQGRAISLGMKQLIEGCLAYEEKNRFSWTDLMKKKILGFEFDKYIKLEQKLKTIELQLAQKIKINAFLNQKTTLDQFNQDTYDLRNHRERIVDFQKRIKNIDEQLESFQTVYIFNQIDLKHQEYVDVQQYENWIQRCDNLSILIKQLQIQDEKHRIVIKQLFIMIYLKIQDNNCNLDNLIDEHECIFDQKKQGIILSSKFVDFIKAIDNQISQSQIQIAKKYIIQMNDLILGRYIKNVTFVQFYEQFWRVNLIELRSIYQLLDSYQITQQQQSQGYLYFIKLFDQKIIDRFISLDLLNYRIKQNNLEDLFYEIQIIRDKLNIEY